VSPKSSPQVAGSPRIRISVGSCNRNSRAMTVTNGFSNEASSGAWRPIVSSANAPDGKAMRQFQHQLQQKLEQKQRVEGVVPPPPVRKGTTCLQDPGRGVQAGHQSASASERVSPYNFPQRSSLGSSAVNKGASLMDWNGVPETIHQQDPVVFRSCVGSVDYYSYQPFMKRLIAIVISDCCYASSG